MHRPRDLTSITIAATFVALCCGLALAQRATAHGGALLLQTDAGPYALVLNAATLQRDPRAVDYTVTLRRDSRPEEAAAVHLRVRTGANDDWSRRYTAQRATNTYEVVLSQPDRDSWRTWDVRLEIDGPGGTAATTYTAATARTADPPAPVTRLVASLGALALLAGGAVVAVRHRRR